jgi:hypothetical protein
VFTPVVVNDYLLLIMTVVASSSKSKRQSWATSNQNQIVLGRIEIVKLN